MKYNSMVSDRDWLIAFLLCFFAGAIGLHRFYCGKIVSGIVYILTIGGFGIGVLVDLILILCKKFKDSEGLYLKKCFLE